MMSQQQYGICQFAGAAVQRSLTQIANHDCSSNRNGRDQQSSAKDKPPDWISWSGNPEIEQDEIRSSHLADREHSAPKGGDRNAWTHITAFSTPAIAGSSSARVHRKLLGSVHDNRFGDFIRMELFLSSVVPAVL